MSVPAFRLETVKTVFMELFCTPKSSTENPSLRSSGHSGSTSRTFIVEDYAEDEYGQWVTDEVTGEQGYMDDERSCFWTWDDIEYVWQCRKFKDRQLKKRKVKEKEKAREDSKEKEEYSLVENKHRILNGSLKKMVLGGPKQEEARGVHRKVKITSLKMAFALTYQKRM